MVKNTFGAEAGKEMKQWQHLIPATSPKTKLKENLLVKQLNIYQINQHAGQYFRNWLKIISGTTIVLIMIMVKLAQACTYALLFLYIVVVLLSVAGCTIWYVTLEPELQRRSSKIFWEDQWYWIHDFVATFGVNERPIYMALWMWS